MVNGNFSCNHSYLEASGLRGEWGFPGFMTSDYGALHSTQGVLQGTDMEQPENTYYGNALKVDLQKGTIPRSALNTMVQRILTQMFQYNLFSQPLTGSTSATVTTSADVAVAPQRPQARRPPLKNPRPSPPLGAARGGTRARTSPPPSA